MKLKLKLKEQVEYMRDKKGIQFNIVSEQEAYEFLRTSTYYFKLKAFAKNYEKYSNPNTEQYGKYINLEFAYLKELSILDARFRNIVLKMSLDVEHFLKVQLVSDLSENPDDDGYKLLTRYLNKVKPDLLDSIKSKSKNSYSNNIIKKYEDGFAIWNIIEVISFGDFIDFYDYYYSYYPTKDSQNVKGKLLPIKLLRNAAAHNNCLINCLGKPYAREIEPNKNVMSKIAKIKRMPKKTREAKMKNPPVHDFIVLIDVYCNIIKSEKTLFMGFEALNEFLKVRCLKHKDYFIKNDIIKTNYEFLVKVVDFYAKLAYNKVEEQKV